MSNRTPADRGARVLGVEVSEEIYRRLQEAWLQGRRDGRGTTKREIVEAALEAYLGEE